MLDLDEISRPAPDAPRLSRRHRRAARLRARALSPRRIVASILAIPVLTVALTLSIYVRTSPFAPPQAAMHLVARFGCDAAARVGLVHMQRGDLGYHARNDPDGNGVACEWPARNVPPKASNTPRPPAPRMAGGAKFVKP